MQVTPARKSVRPRRGRGRRIRRAKPRRDNFAQEYERLVDELLDSFLDEELDAAGSRLRVFFRLDGDGVPDAALIFDPETGQTVEKLRFPLAGGEAA